MVYIIAGILIILLLIFGVVALINKMWSGISIIGFSILLGITLILEYKDRNIDKYEYTVLTKITTSETTGAITETDTYYIIVDDKENVYITTSNIQLKVEKTYSATKEEFTKECKPVLIKGGKK